MKTSKNNRKIQKRFLEAKFKSIPILVLNSFKTPPSGWLKAMREALGISSEALAKRIGIKSSSGVLRLEEREVSKKATIESLENAARAMDCRLVYLIIPDNEEASLEKILSDKAYRVAEKLVRETKHTMNLEDQKAKGNDEQEQIKRLAKELKDNFDSRIWKEK